MNSWEIVLPSLVLTWLFGYGLGLAHLSVKKFLRQY